MTERVLKAWEEQVKFVSKHKCCGRRFKRKMMRLLRMNAYDVKQEKLNEANENSSDE